MAYDMQAQWNDLVNGNKYMCEKSPTDNHQCKWGSAFL